MVGGKGRQLHLNNNRERERERRRERETEREREEGRDWQGEAAEHSGQGAQSQMAADHTHGSCSDTKTF